MQEYDIQDIGVYCFSGVRVMGRHPCASGSGRFRPSGTASAPGVRGKKRRQYHDFPFSLYEVLRYLLPGAAGETKNQMEAVLPGDGAIRKQWSFLSQDFSRSWRCYSASRIFADRSVKLKEDYERAVGTGRVVPAPFRENKAEAVRQVNAWAAKNTGGRIRNLLNQQEISGRTALVLANAVYMRAFWESRFEGKTEAQAFFREDGSSCIMPMMKQ